MVVWVWVLWWWLINLDGGKKEKRRQDLKRRLERETKFFVCFRYCYLRVCVEVANFCGVVQWVLRV